MNSRPDTRLVEWVASGPIRTGRPRSQPLRPRSKRSHASARTNRGAAMPSAYSAMSVPPYTGSPPAAETVSTLPSSGPEQKPASAYTVPSANTEAFEETLMRAVARCAAAEPKPRPRTIAIPSSTRTIPPTMVAIPR